MLHISIVTTQNIHRWHCSEVPLEVTCFGVVRQVSGQKKFGTEEGRKQRKMMSQLYRQTSLSCSSSFLAVKIYFSANLINFASVGKMFEAILVVIILISGAHGDCGHPGYSREARPEIEDRPLFSFREGETIIYSCQQYGDIVIGNMNRTCKNNEWSGVVPKCG